MTENRQEHFDLLQELGGTGELKLGLQGGQGSGKTFTAVEVAIGLIKYWKLDGPVAMFDTEKGSAFVRNRIVAETGRPPVGFLGRSRDKLLRWLEQVVKAGIPVAIIDSITHVSDETRDSFVAQRNKQKNRKDRRLSIDEIMMVQDAWKPVVDAIINAPIHLICCGRLGFEWGHEDVDGSGNLQLVRTDRKMKAMGGFGYELDLVCDLARETKRVAPGRPPERGKDRRKRTILSDESIHRLTVVKDRFDELDGCQVDDPTFEFFRPYIDKLERGTRTSVNVSLETDHGLESDGSNQWRRDKREREIIVEKAKEELLRCWPGASAAEKKAKADHLEAFFGTRSWTEISESLPIDKLQNGWMMLFRYCRKKFPAPVLFQRPETAAATVTSEDVVEREIPEDKPKPEEPGVDPTPEPAADEAGETIDPPEEIEETPGPTTPSSLERLHRLEPGDRVRYLIESGPGSKSGVQEGKVKAIDVEDSIATVIPKGKRKPITVPLRPSVLQAVDDDGRTLL